MSNFPERPLMPPPEQPPARDWGDECDEAYEQMRQEDVDNQREEEDHD